MALLLLPREVCFVEFHHLYVGDAPGQYIGIYHGEVVVSEIYLLEVGVSTHHTDKGFGLLSAGFLSLHLSQWEYRFGNQVISSQ